MDIVDRYIQKNNLSCKIVKYTKNSCLWIRSNNVIQRISISVKANKDKPPCVQFAVDGHPYITVSQYGEFKGLNFDNNMFLSDHIEFPDLYKFLEITCHELFKNNKIEIIKDKELFYLLWDGIVQKFDKFISKCYDINIYDKLADSILASEDKEKYVDKFIDCLSGNNHNLYFSLVKVKENINSSYIYEKNKWIEKFVL